MSLQYVSLLFVVSHDCGSSAVLGSRHSLIFCGFLKSLAVLAEWRWQCNLELFSKSSYRKNSMCLQGRLQYCPELMAGGGYEVLFEGQIWLLGSLTWQGQEICGCMRDFLLGNSTCYQSGHIPAGQSGMMLM